MSDYYKILDVNKDASEKEIKKAYRKLALKHHPDKPGGNEEKFKEISEAYDVISNKEKRKMYDQYGKDGLNRGNAPDFHFSNQDASRIFEQFFNFGSNEINIPEFNLFNRLRKMKDNPLLYDVNCTLEELDYGTNKKIKITRNVYKRTGKIIKEEKVYNIDIRPGWKEGTKITYKCVGDVHEGMNREPADIIFTIHQKYNKSFRRESNNIIVNLDITLCEALIGFTKIIQSLRNEKLKISSDNVVKPNHKLIVKRKGFTIKNNVNNIDVRGDIVVICNVIFPNKLTDEQKEYIKQAFI